MAQKKKVTTTRKRKRRASTVAKGSPTVKGTGTRGTAVIGAIIPTKFLSDVRVSVIQNMRGGRRWGLEVRSGPTKRFPRGWEVRSLEPGYTKKTALARLPMLLRCVEDATSVVAVEDFMRQEARRVKAGTV